MVGAGLFFVFIAVSLPCMDVMLCLFRLMKAPPNSLAISLSENQQQACNILIPEYKNRVLSVAISQRFVYQYIRYCKVLLKSSAKHRKHILKITGGTNENWK